MNPRGLPFIGPLKKNLDSRQKRRIREDMKSSGCKEMTVNALDTYVRYASRKGGFGDKALFSLWTLATLPLGYYLIFYTKLPFLVGNFFFVLWAAWGYALFWERFKKGREVRKCLKKEPEEIFENGRDAFECNPNI